MSKLSIKRGLTVRILSIVDAGGYGTGFFDIYHEESGLCIGRVRGDSTLDQIIAAAFDAAVHNNAKVGTKSIPTHGWL